MQEPKSIRKGWRVKKLAALALVFLAFSAPANAEDEFQGGDEQTQVIPPAVVENQTNPKASKPIDLNEVEITTMTPADEFAAATTPLVVALMFGSVGLVVYTLATQGRQD